MLIEIQDKENIEEEFLNFIKGKEINKEIFIKIGKLLKNKEMIKIWKKANKDNNQIKEIIIEYLKCITEINDKNEDIEDIKEEINYIAKHLEEMKEEVKQLREEELIYIIQNENLSIKSEDTIWEIIKERMKKMKKKIKGRKEEKKEIKITEEKRRVLMENIKVKYLNKTNFKEYIEELEVEDMLNNSSFVNYSQSSNSEGKDVSNLWNQIQVIILNNLQNLKYNEKEENNLIDKKEEKLEYKLIEHQEGKNFEGIIKYLEDKYGKNIHEQGIITITASSTDSKCIQKPEKVIDYGWNSY